MRSFYFAHPAAMGPGLHGLPLKHIGSAGLLVLLLSVTAFSQGTKPVVSCESLARLELREATVTTATTMAAGEVKAPTQSSGGPGGPGTPGAQGGPGGPGGRGGPGGGGPPAPFDSSDLPQPACCRTAVAMKPSGDSDI